MKKLFIYSLIIISSMIFLTSCETVAVAATPVDTEVIYYDSNNNLTVVYINGIANYRYWDNLYCRYYYRPVPHHRYHYIHRHPAPHHRYHYIHRHPAPRPHIVHSHPHHPSHHGNVKPDRPSHHGNINRGHFGSSTRITAHNRPQGHSHNRGSNHAGSHHFGGRR